MKKHEVRIQLLYIYTPWGTVKIWYSQIMIYTSMFTILLLILLCIILLLKRISQKLLNRPYVGLQNCIKVCENKSMSKKELTNAIKVAEDIIKRFGITEPPVLAKEFAEIHGLSIVYVNFDKINPQYNKISGFIDIDTNKLYVNADESPKRQNFTIAHELGHFLLGHLNSSEYSVLYRNNELSDSPLEREANCFAANLLVPEKLLRKTLKDYPFITDNQLGNLFGVSEIVIKNRKKHLGVCC